MPSLVNRQRRLFQARQIGGDTPWIAIGAAAIGAGDQDGWLSSFFLQRPVQGDKLQQHDSLGVNDRATGESPALRQLGARHLQTFPSWPPPLPPSLDDRPPRYSPTKKCSFGDQPGLMGFRTPFPRSRNSRFPSSASARMRASGDALSSNPRQPQSTCRVMAADEHRKRTGASGSPFAPAG